MGRLLSQKVLLIISSASMLLFSTSFLIMPLASKLSIDGDNSLLIVSGLWFWLPVIMAGITFFFANKRRREEAHDVKSKSGIFRFFTNTWAKVADVAFGISLIGLITVLIFASQSYFVFIFISLSVFTFLMHCVLNGKNFLYYIETNNIKKSMATGESKGLLL